MRTTKFYGEINGESFDNVNDYNDMLKSLMDSGCTEINAKSETKIVNEQPKKIEYPLPGLKGDDLVGYIVSSDNDVTDVNLADALKEMEDVKKDVLKKMESWNACNVDCYLGKLRKSLDNIKNYKELSGKSYINFKNQIDKLQSQINELVEKQDIVINAEMVLGEFEDWYLNFIRTIKNIQINSNESNSNESNCKCNNTCNCDENCTCKCTKEPQEITYEIKPKNGIKELAKLLGII